MRRISSLLTFVFIGMAAHWWSSGADAARSHNRLATNRLATNRLATNRLATNRAGDEPPCDKRARGQPRIVDELLATPEGRDVYAYMMSCALPAGVTIAATIPGAHDSGPSDPAPYDTTYTCRNEDCVFDGGIGLAPKWIDRKLNKKGQRWISACLFARVNAYATTEAISLRGNHDALTAGLGEIEEYGAEEGAFYGQYFTPPEEPIAWFACTGQHQASAESGGLNLRDCTEPDPDDPTHTKCGFNYAGECDDFTPEFPSAYACKTRDDGFYEKCHEQPRLGAWPKIKKYKEVITVFVAN